MRRVILESPYSGDVERNVRYAQACVRDCLLRGEAPLASHLLYTQEGILRDEDEVERDLGMRAGWEWYAFSEACVVYTDLGISSGMQKGIDVAKSYGIPREMRSIKESGW